eukprot:7073971-Pyramimonas_sp.AAC.1
MQLDDMAMVIETWRDFAAELRYPEGREGDPCGERTLHSGTLKDTRSTIHSSRCHRTNPTQHFQLSLIHI